MIAIVLHKHKFKGTQMLKSIGENFCTHATIHESLFQIDEFSSVSNSIKYPKKSAEIILNLYKKKKQHLLRDLNLEFSFGIIDSTNNSFFGARDRMGVKSFYYYNSDDIFIYSTEISFIKNYLNINKLDDKWILSSLTGLIYSNTTSPLETIKKLPPAHYIELKDNKITINKYWSFKRENNNSKTNQEYINLLKLKFENAVKNRIVGKIGSELSGGLDSSGIVGILSHNKVNVNTYTHTLQDELLNKVPPFKDERNYRNILVQHCNNVSYNNIDSRNKGLFHEIQNELKIQSVPVSSTLSYLSDGIMNRAKSDGIDTLFSGFGGDEGLSNYGTLLLYQYAREFKFTELHRASGLSYLSKAYWSKLIKPNINPISIKNKWREYNYNLFFLNNSFAKKEKLDSIYWNYISSKTVHKFDEYLLVKLNENYISNRTESLGISARSRGLEYTYPFLDMELLETYLSTPNKLKYNKGVGRYIYREIIKDYVPNKIYQRKDKTGATVPNVLVRFMKDYRLIEEFLYSSRKGKAMEYIDFNKMIKNMSLIKQLAKGEKVRANQNVFFNALMIILYLENEY